MPYRHALLTAALSALLGLGACAHVPFSTPSTAQAQDADDNASSIPHYVAVSIRFQDQSSTPPALGDDSTSVALEMGSRAHRELSRTVQGRPTPGPWVSVDLLRVQDSGPNRKDDEADVLIQLNESPSKPVGFVTYSDGKGSSIQLPSLEMRPGMTQRVRLKAGESTVVHSAEGDVVCTLVRIGGDKQDAALQTPQALRAEPPKDIRP